MTKPLSEGQRYTARIEGYASDGAGVARIDGMAVFIKGALRGELVELLVEHVGHSAAWARTEQVLEASPARTAPDCPYYGQCGGCQFRHMSYEEEREAKRLRVEDALRRIGGADITVPVIHGAENTKRYRNKVQFPVSNHAVGYYQGRTHQVVDIQDCLLQPELDSACRAAFQSWMRQFHIPAYQERTGQGLVRHLFLRTNSAGEVLCCVVVNGKSLPHERELTDALRAAVPSLIGVVLSVNQKKTNVILGEVYRTLWGRDWLEETLCGHRFRLSVPSFFQVNRVQTEILYRRALEFAGLTG